MQSPVLPVEVCEAVFDCVYATCAAALHKPLGPWPECRNVFRNGQRTLSACARVCAAWRTHAQFVLWRIVFIDLGKPHCLTTFVAIVRAAPDRWAPLISSVILDGRPMHNRGPPRRDVGQAGSEIFMLSLPNLRFLCCIELDWRLNPILLRARLPLLAPVTHLVLSWCRFQDMKILIYLLASAPVLVQLRLLGSWFVHEKQDDSRLMHLVLARNHLRACRHLTDLRIEPPTLQGPVGVIQPNSHSYIGRILGPAVTVLRVGYMTFADSEVTAFHYGALPALREFHVDIWEGGSGSIAGGRTRNPHLGLAFQIARTLERPTGMDQVSLHLFSRFRDNSQHDGCAALVGRGKAGATQSAGTTQSAGAAQSLALESLLSGGLSLPIHLHVQEERCKEHITAAFFDMNDVLKVELLKGWLL